MLDRLDSCTRGWSLNAPRPAKRRVEVAGEPVLNSAQRLAVSQCITAAWRWMPAREADARDAWGSLVRASAEPGFRGAFPPR